MSFLRLGESERSAARSSSQAGQPSSSICTIKDSPLLNFDRNSGNEILIGSELVRTDEKRAKRDSDKNGLLSHGSSKLYKGKLLYIKH